MATQKAVEQILSNNGEFKRGLLTLILDLLKVWGPMAAILGYFLYADHANRKADLDERKQLVAAAEIQLKSNAKLTDALLADLEIQQANYLAQMALFQEIDARMAEANKLAIDVRERELVTAREIAQSLKAFTDDVLMCHEVQNRKLDTIVEQTKPDGG